MRRLKLLACMVFVYAVLIAACMPARAPKASPKRVITFVGDPSFSDYERGLIQKGANAWGQYSNGIVEIRIVWAKSMAELVPPLVIVRANAEDFEGKPNTLAFTYMGNYPSVVFIIERSLAVGLDAVAVHEFGHALGLVHSENTDDIMFYAIRPYIWKACPRKGDMVQLCGIYDCTLPQVDYCGP